MTDINIQCIVNENTMTYLNALQKKDLTREEVNDYETQMKEDLVAGNPHLFKVPVIVYCFYEGSYPTMPTASKVFVRGTMTFEEFVKHMEMSFYKNDDDYIHKFNYTRFMVASTDRPCPMGPTIDCNSAVPIGCFLLEGTEALKEWLEKIE